MTETEKKHTLPEPIPVDAKKLIDGLGTIFGGVIQLLAAMEPGMTKELADMAINGRMFVDFFGWLGSVGNYINVLHECSGINTGDYYLAWKAITDNTSPMIRSVKIVDVTI